MFRSLLTHLKFLREAQARRGFVERWADRTLAARKIRDKQRGLRNCPRHDAKAAALLLRELA